MGRASAAAARRSFAARKSCLLAALVAAVLFGVSPVHAQTSPSTQQVDIDYLQLVLEVKQQRVEALEKQLESLRRELAAERAPKILAEIQRGVERVRGLRAKKPIEMTALTPEILEELIDDQLDEVYPEEQFDGWAVSLKHLGLIPRDMQMRPFLKALMSEQIAGAYDDKTKKLYISDRFDLDSTFAKIILAHEICHALQDQHFDLLGSPIHDKTNDDRAMAAMTVIEGDATILMSEYMSERLSWSMLLELPGLLMMDQQQLSAAPPYFSQSLLFPYIRGMNFVMEYGLLRGSRNELFEDLPRSTEQILHPEKYTGPIVDEPTEISLDALTSGGLIPDKNRFNNVAGEFGIKLLLDQHLPPTSATLAAAGWDGDRLVAGGRLDGAYILAWLSVWDTALDAGEFADALAHYFRAQRPRLVERRGNEPPGTWLSDRDGWVVIVVEKMRVACVHAPNKLLVTRLVEAVGQVEIQPLPAEKVEKPARESLDKNVFVERPFP